MIASITLAGALQSCNHLCSGPLLMAVLQGCASNIAPSTMHAIIGVESGGNSWALGDNTTRRSYSPRSYADAVLIANALIARGDSVDVGIAQINSANFRGYHTNAATMLFPCQNLIVASQILGGAYTRAAAVFPEPRLALWHSISAYNTGSLYAGTAYVNRVVAQAIQAPLVPSIELLENTRASFSSASVSTAFAIPTGTADAAARKRKPRSRPSVADFGFGVANPSTLLVRIKRIPP